MKLEELHVYELSMDLAERIWKITLVWDYYAKDKLGKQIVRSADSKAASLSEGFGRYHFAKPNDARSANDCL